MLCSKCYQKIPQEEEIQIEGSIICRKCALDNNLAKKEVIGRCNRCFKMICKDEIVHEVYENWGAENSEKLIKCQHCYKKWLEMAEVKRKSWKLTRWFDNVFLPFSMWTVLATVTISKNKESVGWGPILLMFTLSTSVMILSPLFSDLISKFTLFVYQKILERKYKKLRKERKSLEQKRKRRGI